MSCITACASPIRRWCRPPRFPNRYITDRFLPDKAIDLMDEAASRIYAWRSSPSPRRSMTLDRRIIQLKIEREALKKESDKASQGPARDARGRRLANLEEEQAVCRADPALAGREGEDRPVAKKLKEELDQARHRAGTGRTQWRSGQGRRAFLRHHPGPREEAAGGSRRNRPRAAHAARGGDERRHRRQSCRAGPAFRSTRCSKANAKSCSKMEEHCAASG